MKVGKKSEESSFKLYQGVAALNIITVNPTLEELSDILGKEVSKVPQYVGKDENNIDRVLLSFWTRTDKDSPVNGGIDTTMSFMIGLTNEFRKPGKSGRVQVIDKYGRSAWATPEEVENHSIPQYSKGPANISADYHRAIPGEETLLGLLKAWLNIPDVSIWNKDSEKWEPNTKVTAEDCEMSLDFGKMFNGDFSELKSLIKDAAGYNFKCATGVRNYNGAQYQDVYTGTFLRNGARKYENLMSDIVAAQSAGAYSSSEFDCEPLHEYNPQATNFDKPEEAAADPWK